jgi:AcrR family transcriptional regulator
MSETAERLMNLAEARIREAGYRGFSFRGLAAEIGIKSASVHHHFPTKAGMAATVARRYGNRFFEVVAPRHDGSEDDVVAIYRSAFRGRSSGTVGCASTACWVRKLEDCHPRSWRKSRYSSDAASMTFQLGLADRTRWLAPSMSWQPWKEA